MYNADPPAMTFGPWRIYPGGRQGCSGLPAKEVVDLGFAVN